MAELLYALASSLRLPTIKRGPSNPYLPESFKELRVLLAVEKETANAVAHNATAAAAPITASGRPGNAVN